MIYVWDEIGGEAREVQANETHREEVAGIYATSIGDCEMVDLFGEVPAMIQDGAYVGWWVDHVIDLPDKTRIVIESDERAHTAVWVTTPE